MDSDHAIFVYTGMCNFLFSLASAPPMPCWSKQNLWGEVGFFADLQTLVQPIALILGQRGPHHYPGVGWITGSLILRASHQANPGAWPGEIFWLFAIGATHTKYLFKCPRRMIDWSFWKWPAGVFAWPRMVKIEFITHNVGSITRTRTIASIMQFYKGYK